MTRQTIQILSDPAAAASPPRSTRTKRKSSSPCWAAPRASSSSGLAPEDEDDVEGHLFGAGAIVRLIVRKPGSEDDVEGHALTLHFISAEEASKFKTKVLAGGCSWARSSRRQPA